MSTRWWIVAALAVAGVFASVGSAHAQGRPGGGPMRGGGMGGQMRGGQMGMSQGQQGGGGCAARGQQGQQSQLGTQNLQAMRSTQAMRAANPMLANRFVAPTSSAATSQQTAWRDYQWQQYVRAVGMHPTNQRWLQQGSYR